MKICICAKQFLRPPESCAHGTCHACHTLDTPLFPLPYVFYTMFSLVAFTRAKQRFYNFALSWREELVMVSNLSWCSLCGFTKRGKSGLVTGKDLPTIVALSTIDKSQRERLDQRCVVNE